MIRKILPLMLLISLAGACKKEGTGGDATLSGYIKAQKWNSTFTQYIGEYPARGVDVFIQYGDTLGYDDRVETDYNGYFEFPFLYKGTYHIYTYSRDSTGRDISGKIPVIRTVNITGRHENLLIDTLVVFQ